MRIFKALVIGALLVAAPVFADEEWVTLFKSSNGEAFLDKSSLEIDLEAQAIGMVLKFVPIKPKMGEEYVLSVNALDCANNKAYLMAQMLVFKDKVVQFAMPQPIEGSIIKDSPFDGMCKKLKTEIKKHPQQNQNKNAITV